ncbi:MAG: hypothetical protein NT074_07010 [Methanomicrobiales archaeon]|nr:hypothetical protein [Methanomicrobiales archaeon]
MEERNVIRSGGGGVITSFQLNEVLIAASRAPSPCNRQPWRFTTTGEAQFQVALDHERLLPVLDPYHREGHIAVGAFLETAVIAARGAGKTADLQYFPDGWYGQKELRDLPVARVTLDPGQVSRSDPLCTAISTRQSNMRAYNRRPLSDLHQTMLLDSCSAYQIPIALTQDLGLIQEVATLQARATEVMLEDPLRQEEFFSHFSGLSGRGIVPGGYGLAQCGYGTIHASMMSLVQLMRCYLLNKEDAAASLYSAMVFREMMSAAALGWVSTKGSSRIDQVLAGRAYAAVDLTAAACGVAIHPMTHILGDYPAMKGLSDSLAQLLGVTSGRTIQMLFRVGYARPVPKTERRNTGGSSQVRPVT